MNKKKYQQRPTDKSKIMGIQSIYFVYKVRNLPITVKCLFEPFNCCCDKVSGKKTEIKIKVRYEPDGD